MKLFEKNVGGLDRGLRLVVGLLLLVAALFAQMEVFWKAVVAVVGLAVLFTGAYGTCSLYSFFGVNTAKKKK